MNTSWPLFDVKYVGPRADNNNNNNRKAYNC